MGTMVRSDARENRARILEAAREAFAEDGATSMNQVAQRAGVGAGTLYRNFPTLEALRAWTLDLVTAMRRKHGLGDALTPSAHQSITETTYGPVIGAITALLD